MKIQLVSAMLLGLVMSTSVFAEIPLGQMTPEQLRERIMQSASDSGIDPNSLRFSDEPYNINITKTTQGYGSAKRVVSIEASREDTKPMHVMPSATETMAMPSTPSNYAIQGGSIMLGNTGSTPGLGHRYASPMEGLVNFAVNTPWVHIDGEQEVVKREENETTGWFLFRQFRNHVERSAQEFQNMSQQELDRTR